MTLAALLLLALTVLRDFIMTPPQPPANRGFQIAIMLPLLLPALLAMQAIIDTLIQQAQFLA